MNVNGMNVNGMNVKEDSEYIEPKKVRRNNGGFDFGWWMFLTTTLLMICLFWKDPDLVDAMIYSLMREL